LLLLNHVMDSLTQIVLGAGVGELVLGKKIGNKAQLIGAIAGTVPDLDVFVTMYLDNDLADLVVHRSYSHALLTHVLLAFPMAWICYRMFKRKIDYRPWYWLWFLCLATHAILDSFTTYGTQLFLPFTNYLVGFNNISVIDPLYTLPFMGILIYCLFLNRNDPRRHQWAWRSVYISSAYMALTFVSKWYVHNTFSRSLKEQQITYKHLSTAPTFFNNALWAGIAYDDSTMTIGEYSIFQKDQQVDFVRYKRNLQLEDEFRSKELETVKWFSLGMYILERKDSQTLNVYVTKWGRTDFGKSSTSDAFIFYYQIRRDGDHFTLKNIQPEFTGEDMSKAFAQLWNRIWSK
jgi:inner membrane protein